MDDKNIKRCESCGGWKYVTRECVTCSILKIA